MFDVDGTLVDSATDICGAIRDALAGTPQANCEETFLRGYIGRHLVDLFSDLFPAYSPAQLDELILTYRKFYPARGHKSTKLYPGVVEGLAALPGRKSTATTKGTPMTRSVLELFGLLPFFDHVQGTDGFPHKPAPDVILKSLEVFGATPDQALMIGDSTADIVAGKRAGVRTCAVSYGYGQPEQLAALEPDYWIADLRELVPAAC